jgi:hypothetical protein
VSAWVNEYEVSDVELVLQMSGILTSLSSQCIVKESS